jgi:outer membrane protein assembly factor BamB
LVLVLAARAGKSTALWVQSRWGETKLAESSLTVPTSTKVLWAQSFPIPGCPSINVRYSVSDSLGGLYVSLADGYSLLACVVKVEAKTGKPLWAVELEQNTGAPVDLYPALALSADERRVYVGAAQNKSIAAVDTATGSIIWEAGSDKSWCQTMDHFQDAGASLIACWEIGDYEAVPVLRVLRDDGDHATQLWSRSPGQCGGACAPSFVGCSALVGPNGRKLLFSYTHVDAWPEQSLIRVWAVDLLNGTEVWSLPLGYAPMSIQPPMVLEKEGALLLSLGFYVDSRSPSSVLKVDAFTGKLLANVSTPGTDKYVIGQGTVLSESGIAVFPLTLQYPFEGPVLIAAFNASGDLSLLWTKKLSLERAIYASILADRQGTLVVSTTHNAKFPNQDDDEPGINQVHCYLLGLVPAASDASAPPQLAFNISLSEEFGTYTKDHGILFLKRWGMETTVTPEGLWSPCGPWHGTLAPTEEESTA